MLTAPGGTPAKAPLRKHPGKKEIKQSCLLAVAQTVTMDLHKQLESTERNWNKEKLELLERFDNERKEWECQWKVMQKKIEELYQEVRLRRESSPSAHDNKATQSKMLQLSMHSPTSGESDTVELNYQHNVRNDRMQKGSLLSKPGQGCKDTRAKSRNSTLLMDSLPCESHEEPAASLSIKTPQKSTKNYIGDLNVALRELARVSEELCSYQEEIRKKSNHRRMKSLPFLGEFEESQNTVILPRMNHVSGNESQASAAFETEEHHNRKNLLGSSKALKDLSYGSLISEREADFRPWQKKEAPPVPPRSTSRHLTNSLSAIIQLAETPLRDAGSRSHCKAQDCRGGSKLVSPSPVSQSDTAAAAAACARQGQAGRGPAVAAAATAGSRDESSALGSFCHNTWACDVGKTGRDSRRDPSPLSAQKSRSDGNMAQSNRLQQKPSPKPHSSPYYCADFYAPAPLRSGLLEDSGLGRTQRNETLAAKIDEFNRAVFHTDKGNNTLQANQVAPAAPEDHNPCGSVCDPPASRTATGNASCVSNPKLPAAKEQGTSHPSKAARSTGQQKQANGLPSSSGYRQLLQEHEWRPSDLSGRPRSADSRSNYGVVERLLKNYEKPAVASACHLKCCKEKWTWASSEFTDGACEALSQCLETFQIEQGKQELPRNSARHIGQQLKQGKERQKLPEMSVPAKCSSGKGFSRPARPANRRLPSRWASRSPSAPPAIRRAAYNCPVSFRAETSVV
ncbi:microtubule cross-linking factor 3 isoform X3 [Pogoniulus pusillus]|uniref:microtubule cross-linking factor 3 isoform X3 n=1 Tax=Pogoniulus pusillus TaxID=488313 RepID=UPI0030B9AC6B